MRDLTDEQWERLIAEAPGDADLPRQPRTRRPVTLPRVRFLEKPLPWDEDDEP